MKNKKIGAIVCIVALALAFTQSAFKAPKSAYYGKVMHSPTSWDWEPIAGLELVEEGELGPNTYKCSYSEEQTCTAVFNSTPSPNDPESSAATLGIFEFNR